MSDEAITVREVVRLLWKADSYPCRGNEDWAVAAGMEEAALATAATAVASPDDPPEFAEWLKTLQRTDLSANEREETYWAIHDYFEGVELKDA
jgi:hypothetical protein